MNMRKSSKWTIGLIVCAAVLIAAVVLSMGGVFSAMGLTYANADRYTAGDAAISQPVKNLDIHWINGKVNLTNHKGSGVELRETSRRPIGADLQMRWWLDGDTLRIQFAANQFRLFWNQEKELTVSLPEGLSLGAVNIEATSGDLTLPALPADTVTLNVTSGDITAAVAARTVSVGATSGNIDLKVTGNADTIAVGTTSGRIRAEAEQADQVKLSSTSGGINLAALQVRDCDAGSTSGQIQVEIGASQHVKLGATSGTIRAALDAFAALEIGTTSGDVTVSLPDQPGFTAKLETTSGKVDYSLLLTRQGSAYVCGDGSGKVEIGTTSGNVTIHKK